MHPLYLDDGFKDCIIVSACFFFFTQVVFFQGVISSLRKEVWPFLLGVYPFCSSQEERERFRHAYTEKYWKIDAERYGASVLIKKIAGNLCMYTSHGHPV